MSQDKTPVAIVTATDTDLLHDGDPPYVWEYESLTEAHAFITGFYEADEMHGSGRYLYAIAWPCDTRELATDTDWYRSMAAYIKKGYPNHWAETQRLSTKPAEGDDA